MFINCVNQSIVMQIILLYTRVMCFPLLCALYHHKALGRVTAHLIRKSEVLHLYCTCI